MNAPFRRRYRLLALAAALIAFALYAAPAPQARAQTVSPDWFAWNLKVDFPNSSPRAILTIYEGVDDNPAAVTAESAYDISANCQTFGGLSVAGGAATFAANGYIRCRLPNTVAALADKCSSRMGPFYWFATKVAIGPGSVSNPIAELVSPAGGSSARFSLPRSGATAQTQLNLPGASYLSGQWDVATSDNRVLFGTNGPSIVSVADHFAAESWLGFLTPPGWDSFMGGVAANKVANWSEPQMAGWQGGRTREGWPNARFVYIGHSPSAGTYFTGTMWDIEVDPGCTAK